MGPRASAIYTTSPSSTRQRPEARWAAGAGQQRQHWSSRGFCPSNSKIIQERRRVPLQFTPVSWSPLNSPVTPQEPWDPSSCLSILPCPPPTPASVPLSVLSSPPPPPPLWSLSSLNCVRPSLLLPDGPSSTVSKRSVYSTGCSPAQNPLMALIALRIKPTLPSIQPGK